MSDRELDALIWLWLNDKPLDLLKCRYVDGDIQPPAGYPAGHISPPHYSRDIAAAWLVDKPGWFWDFFETPTYLQVTLYPSLEIWAKRPHGMHPYPKEIICVKVNWDECDTKAEVYALGRCRAALMAAEAGK